MQNVINTTRGPRFIYEQGSPKLIEAGETLPLDLTAAEIKSVQQQVDAGVLAWDGEAPVVGEDVPPLDLTAADLLAKADGMNFMAFKSAAAKVLMEASPATKAEIVAALQNQAERDQAEADAKVPA